MDVSRIPDFVVFWLMLVLTGFSGFCIFTALMGTDNKAKWETQVIKWTGRVLLCLLSACAMVAGSYGFMVLSKWVTMQ